MLSIDDQFPDFELEGAVDGKIAKVDCKFFKGNWTIIFFYPEDFSFICPTEVTGFEKFREHFGNFNTKLVGISVDSAEIHIKWQKELGINYPLLTDLDGILAKQLGVLDETDNKAHRATFVVDPDFRVQFAMVTSKNVGRSVEETVRVFNAIQTGRSCPADYKTEIEAK